MFTNVKLFISITNLLFFRLFLLTLITVLVCCITPIRVVRRLHFRLKHALIDAILQGEKLLEKDPLVLIINRLVLLNEILLQLFDLCWIESDHR